MKRFSKYFPAMRFDVNQAQALANILTMELNLPAVKVKYYQALDGCNGIYFDYDSQYGSLIKIQSSRSRLETILHEVAHHLQFKGYDFSFGLETVHGATFQKAYRRVIRTFKVAYNDPKFMWEKSYKDNLAQWKYSGYKGLAFTKPLTT